MNEALNVYTVYWNPKDFPGRFVVRRFLIQGGNFGATGEHWTAGTLNEARAQLPPGLYMLPRAIEDDSVIVETWI